MSVFNKAFIIGIEKDEEFYKIENSMTHFADKNCILFDYLGMESFINKKSNDMLTQYRKAYYLAKLRRYKESLDLFQKIAEKAFRDEDYLLCYLSQINCRSMSIAIKTISRNPFIFKKYELNEVENLALDSRTTETIFQNMPVEFQKEYSKFSDLYSEEHLHKNVYDMFIENEKLKKNMGKNVIESGITSTDKAVLRINNNLHFLLGNGLYVDEFLEFKETIKYSLKLIVEKYSIITKKVLCDDRPFKSNDNITFDEIDVYCFIEYFKSDEIVALMRKCNIKELPLNNVDKIDLMVCNLFEYYNTIASRDVDYFVLSNYEQKLKTCLKLLRYITISSTTIRKICKILFKYRYREIYLNDIILFLDSQIHNDKVSCKEIRKDLLEYIILIIDENIDALKAGKKFEILCTATGYDYWDLTRYLKSEKENYISKKLSEKVCWIINSGLNIELKSLYKCEPVLNAKTKRLLIKNAENSFESSFDFELFVNFISNKRVVNIHIKDLKRHLNSIVESQNKNNKNRNIITFPKRDPLEDMVNVGYWILSGYLNQNDFSEYVGIYDKFDFYYNPKKFDYSKFDVSWLFDLTTGAYQAIFKDKIVKEKVMGCIAKTLRENDIEKGEKEELIRVLTEYIL